MKPMCKKIKQNKKGGRSTPTGHLGKGFKHESISKFAHIKLRCLQSGVINFSFSCEDLKLILELLKK